jgi:hypothetical protein
MSKATVVGRGMLVGVLVLTFIACRALGGPDYTLHVINGTALPLTVIVNGHEVGIVAARASGEFPPRSLASLPWSVEARTSSGRVVLTLTVPPGSVVEERHLDGTGSYSAPAARVDLSCGRLDIYPGRTGPLGPMPGPGVPGDCDP